MADNENKYRLCSGGAGNSAVLELTSNTAPPTLDEDDEILLRKANRMGQFLVSRRKPSFKILF
jgi:hypothetical protein